jgi:hypothetical protein
MFKVEGYGLGIMGERLGVRGDGNWISNFGLRISDLEKDYRLQVDVET